MTRKLTRSHQVRICNCVGHRTGEKLNRSIQHQVPLVDLQDCGLNNLARAFWACCECSRVEGDERLPALEAGTDGESGEREQVLEVGLLLYDQDLKVFVKGGS